MQFLKLPYELITDNKITSNEFRVYSYLLTKYNEYKKCAYPSIEVIAEKVNISVRTVKTCIKNLVALGYMVITKKKGLHGNYNEYTEFKFLVPNKEDKKEEKKEEVKPEVKKEEPKKKEVKKVKKPVDSNGNEIIEGQLHIEEVLPYTREHQQKISLILKHGIKLNDKQMNLCNEFNIEVLKDALYSFKKETKTNTFAFLIKCYYTSCGKYGVIPSMDIQRYCKEPFISVPDTEEGTEEPAEATEDNFYYYNDELASLYGF